MSGSEKGIDVGTNMLVTAQLNEEGKPIFKMQRDAFYLIRPKSEVNKNSIRNALNKREFNFIEDTDGSFIIVGEEALEMAIERNDVAKRPLRRGVISPKEKNSLPMLKLLIENLLGRGEGDTNLVYSVPAKPIDGYFDIVYHTEIMGAYLGQMGYKAQPINEAFAIALSELLDEGLTGIAVSCLVPGTKIYTNNGIVNIEDVKENDEVITHKGRFKRVNKVVTKQFSGVCTKIQLQGYVDNTEQCKFVDNHELLVNRDNKWSWVGCEDIEVGDIVGEPIIKQDLSRTRPSMTICERITSSKTYSKKSTYIGPNVQRLIGYFLGDGSICERDSGIQFDFGENEHDNINDVIEILKRNFGKKCVVVDKESKCKRIKCYSKGLASWFRNHCYGDNKEKVYPWSLDRIDRSSCISLLAGLIRSDGTISDLNISFFNTSTNLTLLCKQLFSKLGVAASISFREPREHELKSGRVIVGKKQEWSVSTGKKMVLNSMSEIITNLNCDNSKNNDRLFINGSFCCGRVQAIEYQEYNGVVYDLQVEDDHSFSGPYLTIHNCGAGMTNVAVIHHGDPLVEFSMTKGGDYIDIATGQALDMSPSLIQLEKESGVDLLNPSNKIMEAVSVYYSSVIRYVLENTAFELKRRKKSLPIFREDVVMIVSGGLVLANGFVQKMNEVLKTVDFPIGVKEIRMAKNPMTAVAAGALLASQL